MKKINKALVTLVTMVMVFYSIKSITLTDNFVCQVMVMMVNVVLTSVLLFTSDHSKNLFLVKKNIFKNKKALYNIII